jgi:hypothetical protein
MGNQVAIGRPLRSAPARRQAPICHGSRGAHTVRCGISRSGCRRFGSPVFTALASWPNALGLRGRHQMRDGFPAASTGSLRASRRAPGADPDRPVDDGGQCGDLAERRAEPRWFEYSANHISCRLNQPADARSCERQDTIGAECEPQSNARDRCSRRPCRTD